MYISIIDIIFFKIAFPVSIILMVILRKCIRNNIVAFKMNFIQEYISENKVSDHR